MFSIRRNTFETNSSSSHSISLLPNYKDIEYDYTLISDCDTDPDYLHISVGEYGWEWVTYDTPTERLKYIVTQIAYSCGACVWCDNESEEDNQNAHEVLYDNYDFKKIVDAVVSNTDYKGIIVDCLEGYVDHQSCMCLDEMLWAVDAQSVEDLIFGPVKSRTGNDNGYDPEENTTGDYLF